MRDIRPTNKPSSPDMGPPEPLPSPKKLYAKQAPAKKPRFTGSSVPVAATPVPQEHEPTQEMHNDEQVEKVKRSVRKRSMNVGDKERKLIAILLVLVVLAIGLAGFLFLPKATIALTIRTAPLLLDQELTLQSVGEARSGIIPSRTFEGDVSVEGASAVLSREVIGTKATGVARIVNRTVDEQSIKEESRLVTSNDTLFYMKKHAIIPPNSAITVPIEAAEAGEEGNIEPQRLDFAALDESAQSIVYAEIDTATTGGSGSEIAVVKEADLDRARKEAAAKARDQVQADIDAQLPNGWVLLEESWTADTGSFETNAVIDAKQDSIPYTASIALRVFAYEEASLQESLQGALEARLDEDHMLFPEPISFTKSVDSLDWENDIATMTVRVTHTTIPAFSLPTLKEKLAGRSQDEARTYLEGLPGVQTAILDISPFWAKRVPRIEKRISIDISSDRNP